MPPKGSTIPWARTEDRIKGLSELNTSIIAFCFLTVVATDPAASNSTAVTSQRTWETNACLQNKQIYSLRCLPSLALLTLKMEKKIYRLWPPATKSRFCHTSKELKWILPWCLLRRRLAELSSLSCWDLETSHTPITGLEASDLGDEKQTLF